jgi:hypothetical protein
MRSSLLFPGRFEVRVEGQPVPLAEIGVGQPIGENAFFAGGLRALRPSLRCATRSCSNLIVPPLRRSRAACRPSMTSLLAVLAQRLAFGAFVISSPSYKIGRVSHDGAESHL